ncbi:MAG: hypothetical protein JO323_24080, partial [Acidobacteriia bacterium]|nr:hypothetical protein [Terriglobia bacterium]
MGLRAAGLVTERSHFGRGRVGRRGFGAGGEGAFGAEAFEFFKGAAVLAFGLGLVAQKQREAVGLLRDESEAFREAVVAVLLDGDIDAAGQFGGHHVDGSAVEVHGVVEAGAEETGFEARGAEHGLLRESHALDGELFLGVDGLVDGDEIGDEVFEF